MKTLKAVYLVTVITGLLMKYQFSFLATLFTKLEFD